jgi:hypothetical protein
VDRQHNHHPRLLRLLLLRSANRPETPRICPRSRKRVSFVARTHHRSAGDKRGGLGGIVGIDDATTVGVEFFGLDGTLTKKCEQTRNVNESFLGRPARRQIYCLQQYSRFASVLARRGEWSPPSKLQTDPSSCTLSRSARGRGGALTCWALTFLSLPSFPLSHWKSEYAKNGLDSFGGSLDRAAPRSCCITTSTLSTCRPTSCASVRSPTSGLLRKQSKASFDQARNQICRLYPWMCRLLGR